MYLFWESKRSIISTSLSENRALSSLHFPSRLREKRFANVEKKHVGSYPNYIINFFVIRKLVLAFASKDFQNDYLEFTWKEGFSVNCRESIFLNFRTNIATRNSLPKSNTLLEKKKVYFSCLKNRSNKG